MEAVSVAIWEKDLVVVGIATGIWGINSAFLIQGKYFPISRRPGNLIVYQVFVE